jgi:lactate permease
VGAALAGLPILVVLVLMVGLRWPASRAGLVGAGLALVVGVAAFDLARGEPDGVAAGLALGGTFGEALFTSATILWIVLPALAIHHLQVGSGATDRLRVALGSLATDPRLFALLIGWFFALFVEGAAGFGASVALAAPFLVGVGYRPLDAVVVAMVGHAIGVSFGAIGTPIVPQVAATGLPAREIAGATADLHLVVGWGLLAVMVVVASRAVGRPARGAIWGWAALAGAAFLLPYWAIARFVGPELPTLGGSLVGAGLFVLALKLVGRGGGSDPAVAGAPAGERDAPPATSADGRATAPDGDGRATAPDGDDHLGVDPGRLAPPFERRIPPADHAATDERPAGAAAAAPSVDTTEPPGAADLLRAGAPYLVLIALVLLTRLVPPVRDAVSTVQLSWTLDGGFSGSFAPLSHPGTLLAASFLLGAAIQGVGAAAVRRALGTTMAQLGGVTIALVAMLSLARLMVHSGMTASLADAAATTTGPAWPVVATVVGVLGTFVTGSATASNVLFTDLQVATAETLDLPVAPMLGAQGYGAAVGNIVCPHNIVAAGATVGLTGSEGDVLRRTLAPALGYALVGGLLTLVLVT